MNRAGFWMLHALTGGLVLFVSTSLFAQNSKQCELMQQRISGTGNVNAVCSMIFQECAAESAQKRDSKEAQNQCLKNLGDCQMAGQLSGDDLQRVVADYEKVCKAQ
jgi:hypothetical protein